MPVDVGNQVKKFREKKKLSQTELAVMIGKTDNIFIKLKKEKENQIFLLLRSSFFIKTLRLV
jgi:transcriptional regulator with XRE-family HTH domain